VILVYIKKLLLNYYNDTRKFIVEAKVPDKYALQESLSTIYYILFHVLSQDEVVMLKQK
jgi:hypothetical protein